MAAPDAASDVTSDLACDVAVVGYGPVGNVLAILLAQLGRSVVVLERWPEPYVLPRACHFDDEIGRILQACDVGDELAALIETAEVYEWRNASGTPLLRLGRPGLGRSGWPRSSMFNQPQLEALLDRRARALPGVEVRRGVEVTAVEPDQAGVTVRGVTADERPVSVRCDYAVGCDGANSTVRGLIGADVHDLGFFYDWLIVDVLLDEERVFDPINLQICDPARPTTAVSGGPGRRRWEFMRLPHESIDELNDEAAAWELLEPWDVTPRNATLERHAVYTFQARWVERWRVGRVLLAGDAAHLMPPFAGQGMCSGLRDAQNLAWKLDLVLGGRADPRLLDTYGEERMPHVRGVIEFSIELGKVICVPDPLAAAERDAAMSAMVVGDEVTDVPGPPGITGGLCRSEVPHAGELFVQATVAEGEGSGRFDDVVGVGWRLVTTPAGYVALERELGEWFVGIGGRIMSVGEGGDLEDPDGTYTRWFADRDCVAALVRPDFHLYGTAATAEYATVLVADLRDDLS